MSKTLRQRIEREAPRMAREAGRRFGAEIRRQREDGHITQRQLAEASGISQSHLSRIEAGRSGASYETASAVALALGATVEFILRVETGSPIRDRIQARIVEALLLVLNRRWERFVEVPVHRPVRGSIDIVLFDRRRHTVLAVEVQSQIRRLEQQLRWANEKARAILPSATLPLARSLAADPSTDSPDVSQLLVLRSTRTNREIVRAFSTTIAVAFPARTEVAFEALVGDVPWPGAPSSGLRSMDRPPGYSMGPQGGSGDEWPPGDPCSPLRPGRRSPGRCLPCITGDRTAGLDIRDASIPVESDRLGRRRRTDDAHGASLVHRRRDTWVRTRIRAPGDARQTSRRSGRT